MFQTLRHINYHHELITMLLNAKIGALGANILVPFLLAMILKDFVLSSLLAASTKHHLPSSYVAGKQGT